MRCLVVESEELKEDSGRVGACVARSGGSHRVSISDLVGVSLSVRARDEPTT